MEKLQLNRYQATKSKIIHGRCSVNDLRDDLRKEFKNRMYTIRNKQLDAHRHILDGCSISNIIKQGFNEMRASLLTDKESFALLDTNAVLEMLSQVKEEILHEELELEAEIHEKELRLETHSIVENLLNPCVLCEKFVDGQFNANVICESCAKIHFFGGDI